MNTSYIDIEKIIFYGIKMSNSYSTQNSNRLYKKKTFFGCVRQE